MRPDWHDLQAGDLICIQARHGKPNTYWLRVLRPQSGERALVMLCDDTRGVASGSYTISALTETLLARHDGFFDGDTLPTEPRL
mgnify:CR=1 FL=1